VRDRGPASVQHNVPPERGRDETEVTKRRSNSPVNDEHLMERVVERENLIKALQRVKRNGGSPGVDGMTVQALPGYLKRHWPAIRQSLVSGTYQPQPVKRVNIPKPGGGIRPLGIPTVLDRFIQQALLQVLQADWDGSFSDHSFGFRPGRSAHQAVGRAQEYLHQGYNWVVDIDLEKFFDRVNHDKLTSLVRERVKDPRVYRLIHRYLKAGVLIGEVCCPTTEGTPQGGPLSPLLANLLLDRLDKELEKRGHRFVRYADDCNIYVRSARAGRRVLAGIAQYLGRHLKLSVNETKSAVDRPWRRAFLGFTFIGRRPNRRKVSEEALAQFKEEIRRRTGRTRGVALMRVITELQGYLRGWKAYFGFSEARSIFKELDSWIHRRLRCYLWKQWGKGRYRALRDGGVSRELAWNTVKSAHGPWRISRSPALAIALPGSYFQEMGLPKLFERSIR
jgi:RNA-directed DNA polymerase